MPLEAKCFRISSFSTIPVKPFVACPMRGRWTLLLLKKKKFMMSSFIELTNVYKIYIGDVMYILSHFVVSNEQNVYK